MSLVWSTGYKIYPYTVTKIAWLKLTHFYIYVAGSTSGHLNAGQQKTTSQGYFSISQLTTVECYTTLFWKSWQKYIKHVFWWDMAYSGHVGFDKTS